MRPGEWTLRSRRVVTPTGTRAADILIKGETIAALANPGDPDREGVILDVGNRLVLPGLVALHGNGGELRGEDSGWPERATRSAAAGGVTTIVDLPIPDRGSTIGPKSFDDKLASTAGQLRVDCGFLGGLVPGPAGQVSRLIEAGVLGIVAILNQSSPEGPPTTAADLREAMQTLARLGRPLLVLTVGPAGDSACSEAASILSLIALAREHTCHVHLLGLSAVDALPMIAKARAEGLSMTVETSVESLIFEECEISGGDPRLKSDSSTRRAIHRERLWDGLRLGTIDSIGSGRRQAVRPGISSLQLALPLVWSEAGSRGFTPDDLARWMSRRPAEILGLAGRKGSIVEGADADFVILDPDVSFVDDSKSIEPARSHPSLKGRDLTGRIVVTILRGQMIYESGRFHGEPQGTPVLRLDQTEPMPNGIERLNHLSQGEALELLRCCCGSSRWAWRLLALRPFSSLVDLLDAADQVWSTLDCADRQEAFAAHPRVSDREALRPGPSLSVSSTGEPSKLTGSQAAVLAELARADREYEAKFDLIFLVANADLPANDILALLRQRMNNNHEAEHRIASWEQAEITRRRLRKLIARS
jgi:allantoinase